MFPQMLLSDTPINLARWNESLHAPPGVEEEREVFEGDVSSGAGGLDFFMDAGRAQPLDVAALVDYVRTDHLPHSVIVDCSPADEATSQHAAWLAKGVHVVSEWAGRPLRRYALMRTK